MANKTMQTHKQWTALKKKYGVPDGAVRSIDMGKAIDKYWNTLNPNPKKNVTIAEETEKVFADYISRFDKKKVKDYAKFEREFLDDYVGCMHTLKEDFKRYNADAETYARELQKFFSAVTKLEAGKTTVTDLQAFKSGPLRGLSAVGSSLGLDLSGINDLCGVMNTSIDRMGPTTLIPQVDNFVAAVHEAAVKIGKLAKDLHILA